MEIWYMYSCTQRTRLYIHATRTHLCGEKFERKLLKIRSDEAEHWTLKSKTIRYEYAYMFTYIRRNTVRCTAVSVPQPHTIVKVLKQLMRSHKV